jgi:hypothetical protein
MCNVLCNRYILELLKRDIKPRDIMTYKAFENAMVTVMATGGSTNAVMHYIAMARAAGVPLSLDDWQRISDKVRMSVLGKFRGCLAAMLCVIKVAHTLLSTDPPAASNTHWLLPAMLSAPSQPIVCMLVSSQTNRCHSSAAAH